MIIDHGSDPGPYPLSEGVDPTLGSDYRADPDDLDLGHDIWNRKSRQWVPGYERGEFFGWGMP